MKASLLKASLLDKARNNKEMSPQAFIASSQSTDHRVVERFPRGLDAVRSSGEHDGISVKWK